MELILNTKVSEENDILTIRSQDIPTAVQGKYAGYLQLWLGRYADCQAIHEAIEGRIATALKEKETLNVGMKAMPTPGK